MIKDAEIPQIENICTRLLQGFIGWIEINDKQEIGIILDSAYDFKHQILNIDTPSLQKNILQMQENYHKMKTYCL